MLSGALISGYLALWFSRPSGYGGTSPLALCPSTVPWSSYHRPLSLTLSLLTPLRPVPTKVPTTVSSCSAAARMADRRLLRSPRPPALVGSRSVSRLHRLYDVDRQRVERVRHAIPVFSAHLFRHESHEKIQRETTKEQSTPLSMWYRSGRHNKVHLNLNMKTKRSLHLRPKEWYC